MADCESVDTRSGIRETDANMDREAVVSTLFRSESKGKRDRDQNVVHSLRGSENLHKIFERTAELAARGEKLARQRFFEAEQTWKSNIGKREILMEINQEFESKRIHRQQASRWADQPQRDKISLKGEQEGNEE